MGMEITGSCSIYAAQNMTESMTEKAKKTQSNVDYMKTLEKLAPSVKLGMGTGLSSARDGKTLNINPKLLEKMQNDPDTKKDMKDMIAGIETAMNISESVNKSLGMKTVFSHWYIDENGKCWHTGYYVSDDTMSKRLREERNKNSEKLIEKRREKAAKLRKEKQEALKEKKTEESDTKKSEKSLDSKRAEQIKEKEHGETGNSEQAVLGVNIDIKA